MAEKIVLAEIDIDLEALIKSTSDVKKAVDELKKQQRELTKEGEQGSKQFVKNAADLRTLRSAYNQNIKEIANYSEAIADAEAREELLNIALNANATSIDEAREQTKLLTKLRNETNVSTEEGAAQLAALNAKLDENFAFVKENADGYLALKLNIGNYTESIKDALNELNPFNGGLAGFISRANDAGGAGNLLRNSLGAVTKSIIGLTKSTLAFLATPIGFVIGAIALAFGLVQNAISRSDKSLNKITVAFSGVQAVIDNVLKALEPLGEFLIDGIVAGFELAGAAIDAYLETAAKILDFIGFEDQAEAARGYAESINKAAQEGRNLANAEIELETAQRRARLTQLEFQKDAEKLRQSRDDETKTFKERIEANDELGNVLLRQLEAEKRVAEQALLVANLRIELEGATKEALDRQAEALTEIADIEERITGQQSEQLTNRVSLQREARDKAREIANERISQQEAELELFIQNTGFKSKTLEQELVIQRQINAQSLEILKAKLKNEEITQTEFDAQVLANKNELGLKTAELAVENAQLELEAFISSNQSKIDNELFFSEELLRIERERLNTIAEERREFERARLEEGIINQTEYNAAINGINEENRVAILELETQRSEAEKAQQAIDLENQRAIDEENNLTQFEIQQARLDAARQQEIKNTESTGADVELINQKFNERQKVLDQSVQDAKLQGFSSVFGQIRGLFGEQTAVGKAAAIAQTTIDTYQSATAAYKSLAGIPVVGPGLATAAAALAVGAGLANIRKITSTKTSFQEGGYIQGARHSEGGVPFTVAGRSGFEAEGGEYIFSRKATQRIGLRALDNMNFNGATPTTQTGVFENGGEVVRTIGRNNASADFAELAQEIRSMKIQVAVEDINTGQGNFADVANQADIG